MVADDGLTKQQKERIERFLHLFTEIENELKLRLKLRPNNKTGVGALSKQYLERNPYWIDSAQQLWLMADIRNLLTHQRNTTQGYPVAVTRQSVNTLEAIRKHLLRPETVTDHFLKEVNCVSAGDSLGHVVAIAFEKGYSQFPVVDAGRFVGLVTENEITRWLGRRVSKQEAAVKMSEVTVRTVIREKDPFRKGIAIFHFVSCDAVLEEVMGLFMSRPMLEVVLITKSGNRKEKIEGIITQWDAARFSH